MVKYEQVNDVRVEENVVKDAFDLGEQLLGKYVGFDSIMGLSSQNFEDMKQLYALAMKFKEESVKFVKQQNLQTEALYDISCELKELQKEVSSLREELNSLKSSETKKKLDDFKKGLNDLGVEEVEED